MTARPDRPDKLRDIGHFFNIRRNSLNDILLLSDILGLVVLSGQILLHLPDMVIGYERVRDIVEANLLAYLALPIGLERPQLGNLVLVVDDQHLPLDFVICKAGIYGQAGRPDDKWAIQSSFIELPKEVSVQIEK